MVGLPAGPRGPGLLQGLGVPGHPRPPHTWTATSEPHVTQRCACAERGPRFSLSSRERDAAWCPMQDAKRGLEGAAGRTAAGTSRRAGSGCRVRGTGGSAHTHPCCLAALARNQHARLWRPAPRPPWGPGTAALGSGGLMLVSSPRCHS